MTVAHHPGAMSGFATDLEVRRRNGAGARPREGIRYTVKNK